MGFFRMHRTLPRYHHSYEQRIEYRITEIRCHLGTTATRAWHTQHGRSPSKVISFTTILFPSVLISIYSKNNRNKQNWHCKKTIGCVWARATCMSGQRHTPFTFQVVFFYYHAVCRVYGIDSKHQENCGDPQRNLCLLKYRYIRSSSTIHLISGYTRVYTVYTSIYIYIYMNI